jgi:hypothetical protein
MPRLFPAPSSSWNPAPKGAAALSDASRVRPRDTRAHEAPQTASGGEEKRGRWLLACLTAIWRRRRTLAPFGASLSLVVVVAVGHAASEGLAWLPLVAGLGVGGAILVGAYRPIHQWYATGAAAAGLWTAAAWWVGLMDPVVLGTAVLLSAAAAAIWLRHHHPRGRVHVKGGSAWPWHWERWHFSRRARREVGEAVRSWEVASYWGRVPRSRIRAAEADIEEDFRLLTVELVPGHIDVDLDNRRAASAIGAPVRDVRIVDQGRDSGLPANVLLIEWYHDGLDLAAEQAENEAGESDGSPEPEDVLELRTTVLRLAVDRLGAEVVSARALARQANLHHDWVNRRLPEIAGRLGLRKVEGGWQRLAVEEEASRSRTRDQPRPRSGS